MSKCAAPSARLLRSPDARREWSGGRRLDAAQTVARDRWFRAARIRGFRGDRFGIRHGRNGTATLIAWRFSLRYHVFDSNSSLMKCWRITG